MPRAWSLTDFIFVFLGGFLGAALLAAAGSAIEDDELFLVLALAGQYLGHLLVLFVLSRRKGHPDLGFAIEGRDVVYLGAGLFLQLGLAILFLPLSTLLLPESESAQQVGTALAGLETTPARIAAIVTAVVLAPVTEELLFRGVLLKVLEPRGRRITLAVTSGVFAIFHLLGLDPTRMLQAAAVVLPQLVIVGLVLAWVTLRSKRLGPAIFIHSGFNLLAAVVLLLPTEMLEPLQ